MEKPPAGARKTNTYFATKSVRLWTFISQEKGSLLLFLFLGAAYSQMFFWEGSTSQYNIGRGRKRKKEKGSSFSAK